MHAPFGRQASAQHRCRVPRPRARPSARRLARIRGARPASARRHARRARTLSHPRNARPPLGTGGFFFCHAGPRQRSHRALRLAKAEKKIPHRRAHRPEDRGLRPLGERGRLRCRRAGHDRHPRRRPLRPQRWQDVDLERRHRRLLRRVRSHRRGSGSEGTERLYRRRHQSRTTRRRSHQDHRVASARDAGVQKLPCGRDAPAWPGGRWLQGGDGHARHLPLHRGRGGAGLFTARAGGGDAPRHDAETFRRSARRHAGHPGETRRHGRGHRRERTARLPRGVGQGPRRGARDARGRDGKTLRDRVGPAHYRRRRAALRRTRCHDGRAGRAALP